MTELIQRIAVSIYTHRFYAYMAFAFSAALAVGKCTYTGR